MSGRTFGRGSSSNDDEEDRANEDVGRTKPTQVDGPDREQLGRASAEGAEGETNRVYIPTYTVGGGGARSAGMLLPVGLRLGGRSLGKTLRRHREVPRHGIEQLSLETVVRQTLSRSESLSL